MALLTAEELAGQTGQTIKTLATYRGRGKVVRNKKGLYDTANAVNAAFIANHGWKTPTKAGHKAPAPVKTTEGDDDLAPEDSESSYEPDSTGINTLQVSDKRYKHFLAQKTERAAELDRIRIEKLKGILVPSAPLIPIFLRHNQYILQEQKNADEEILTMYAHKYDITPEDMASFRGEQVKRRNAAAQRAAEMSERNIEQTINDFSEKKRVA